MAAVAEKDKAAALTVGLSATVGVWILAAAFGGAWPDSVRWRRPGFIRWTLHRNGGLTTVTPRCFP
jgi:hypothetical protein